jgi:hypothetical protein
VATAVCRNAGSPGFVNMRYGRGNLECLIGVYRSMEKLRRTRSHVSLLVVAAMFGALLGFLAGRCIHTASRVASVYTPPVLESASVHADGLVVEAYVDSKGRVWDYRVISNGRSAKDLSPDIKNSLIFTTFRPAKYMGEPVAATAVLSFPNTSAQRP